MQVYPPLTHSVPTHDQVPRHTDCRISPYYSLSALCKRTCRNNSSNNKKLNIRKRRKKRRSSEIDRRYWYKSLSAIWSIFINTRGSSKRIHRIQSLSLHWPIDLPTSSPCEDCGDTIKYLCLDHHPSKKWTGGVDGNETKLWTDKMKNNLFRIFTNLIKTSFATINNPYDGNRFKLHENIANKSVLCLSPTSSPNATVGWLVGDQAPAHTYHDARPSSSSSSSIGFSLVLVLYILVLLLMWLQGNT